LNAEAISTPDSSAPTYSKIIRPISRLTSHYPLHFTANVDHIVWFMVSPRHAKGRQRSFYEPYRSTCSMGSGFYPCWV